MRRKNSKTYPWEPPIDWERLGPDPFSGPDVPSEWHPPKMKPTDKFSFYAVEKGADYAGAAKALERAAGLQKGVGHKALRRGLFANVESAKKLYDAVRPFGFSVRGKDSGRVGSAFRKKSRRRRNAYAAEKRRRTKKKRHNRGCT